MTPAFGFSVGDFISGISESTLSYVITPDMTDRLPSDRPRQKGSQSTERDGWGILGVSSCNHRAQGPQACSTTSPSLGAYRRQPESCERYTWHGPCLPAASPRFLDQIGKI